MDLERLSKLLQTYTQRRQQFYEMYHKMGGAIELIQVQIKELVEAKQAEEQEQIAKEQEDGQVDNEEAEHVAG